MEVLLLRERAPSGPGESIDVAALAAMAKGAWYWPEASEVILRAKSATRITAPEAPTALDRALLLTANAVKAIDASVIAVVWV